MSSPAAVLWPAPSCSRSGPRYSLWRAWLQFSTGFGRMDPTHGLWLGTSAVCAGLFVFMAAVADRWFPSADRRLVAFTEGVVFSPCLGPGPGLSSGFGRYRRTPPDTGAN